MMRQGSVVLAILCLLRLVAAESNVRQQSVTSKISERNVTSTITQESEEKSNKAVLIVFGILGAVIFLVACCICCIKKGQSEDEEDEEIPASFTIDDGNFGDKKPGARTNKPRKNQGNEQQDEFCKGNAMDRLYVGDPAYSPEKGGRIPLGMPLQGQPNYANNPMCVDQRGLMQNPQGLMQNPQGLMHNPQGPMFIVANQPQMVALYPVGHPLYVAVDTRMYGYNAQNPPPPLKRSRWAKFIPWKKKKNRTQNKPVMTGFRRENNENNIGGDGKFDDDGMQTHLNENQNGEKLPPNSLGKCSGGPGGGAPGSMTANSMTANSMTANSKTANSMTANSMTANSITAPGFSETMHSNRLGDSVGPVSTTINGPASNSQNKSSLFSKLSSAITGNKTSGSKYSSRQSGTVNSQTQQSTDNTQYFDAAAGRVDTKSTERSDSFYEAASADHHKKK